MVFVKVRETYDLHTVQNKMTVIAIHTPKPDIIKRNYSGLLMQCKMYRPVSADVRIACASTLPLDPRGVGTTTDDVAPEDIFNPILYKAISNKGMSQLEARIRALAINTGADVVGQTADVDVDSLTSQANEFDIYYGLLSDTHGWKHANPQSGLEMKKLRPLVYEIVYNVGDSASQENSTTFMAPGSDGYTQGFLARGILGNAKEYPFIPCTVYDAVENNIGTAAGFPSQGLNAERNVPYLPVVCGAIIVPPSRLHTLYYRMVVEWTIEFSQIRSLVEVADWPNGVGWLGYQSHFQNYTYSSAKKAVTGDEETMLDSDQCMVSANVEVEKVM